jgi:hypothetical protein
MSHPLNEGFYFPVLENLRVRQIRCGKNTLIKKPAIACFL